MQLIQLNEMELQCQARRYILVEVSAAFTGARLSLQLIDGNPKWQIAADQLLINYPEDKAGFTRTFFFFQTPLPFLYAASFTSMKLLSVLHHLQITGCQKDRASF